MNSISFNTTHEIAELMVEDLKNYVETDDCSCYIGYYDEVKDLISSLIMLGEGEIDLIESNLPGDMIFTSGEEIILTLDSFGIWVQPLNNMEYCCNSLYIDADCNSKILFKNSYEDAEVTIIDINRDIH